MTTSTAAAFGLPPLHDPTKALSTHERLIDSKIIDAQVATAMAPLKTTPENESESLTFVLRGEPLQVLGEKGPWLLCVSVIDGYLGWLDQTMVTPGVKDPTHRLSVPLSHIYSAPDLKSNPLSTLVMGCYVNVTGSAQNKFMPLDGGGWVYARHLEVIGAYVDTPVRVAESFIGAPYLWGGRSAFGIDCSGLVQLALAACGHRVHRDSGTQFASLGRTLKTDEAPMRGDLAFFPGHVGWMLDNVHLLHANATNMAVTVDTVDEVTEWVAAETDKAPFLGYKRL